MEIGSLNLNNISMNKITSFKSNPIQASTRTLSDEENMAYLNAMGTYNMPKIEEAEELDFDELGDKDILEEFDFDEIKSKDINDAPEFSTLAYCSSGWDAQEIRDIINNSPIKNDIKGYLGNYLKALEGKYTKYGSMPQQKIDESLTDREDRALKTLAEAILNMRKLNSTKREHTVYRTLSPFFSSGSDGASYIQSLKNLKPGETTMLSYTPVFVSTAAKRTAKTYGKGEEGTFLRIKLPQESRVYFFSTTDGKNEGVMEPCAEFKVLDNKKYKNNINLIDLEYIIPQY